MGAAGFFFAAACLVNGLRVFATLSAADAAAGVGSAWAGAPVASAGGVGG
jgi:hypothetical protein